MGVRANLKVVLMADDHVLAESDDAELMQFVFQRIYGLATLAPESQISRADAMNSAKPALGVDSPSLHSLATKLGVTTEVLVGACRPTAESPYVTLDHRCWETFKRETPVRGPGATGATAVAATLQALWLEAIGKHSPTLADASKVLKNLGALDYAPKRTIRNCRWLQLQGNQILLNPANISQAYQFAVAFCTKDWSKYHDRRKRL